MGPVLEFTVKKYVGPPCILVYRPTFQSCVDSLTQPFITRSRTGGGGRHVPPLYFQHQGHSRTIVGVEVMKSGVGSGGSGSGGGGTSNNASVRLLVFDPSNSKMANFLAGTVWQDSRIDSKYLWLKDESSFDFFSFNFFSY